MENENTNITTTTNVENTTDTYLAEIEKLKATPVDKAAYDKLLAENRKLITTLAQSPARGEEEQAPAPKPDLIKLGRDFLNAKSDIEKAQLSLDYRDACLAAGERDPFLPTADSYTPTEEDQRGIEAYCSTVKNCIEAAKGNDKIFITMFGESMPADDGTIAAIVANNKKRLKKF